MSDIIERSTPPKVALREQFETFEERRRNDFDENDALMYGLFRLQNLG